jgi:hypothetical protein
MNSASRQALNSLPFPRLRVSPFRLPKTKKVVKKYLFVISNITKRMELTNSLKLPVSTWEGRFPVINKASCISNNDAWIEGELEFLYDFRSSRYCLSVHLPHPSFIEEALVLLGFSRVTVECLVFNHALHFGSISLHPHLNWSKLEPWG